jgi:hypothetical protein
MNRIDANLEQIEAIMQRMRDREMGREHRRVREYVPWRDPMIWIIVAAVVIVFGGGAWITHEVEHPRAPWGATVPTECRALREQARAFTQGAVDAGRPLGGSPVDRALVAIAELQLWQAEGCQP